MSNHYNYGGKKGQPNDRSSLSSLSHGETSLHPINEDEDVTEHQWSAEQILNKIGSERKYSDVMFKIHEKVIPAHMVIIAAQSNPLSKLILSEMNPESGVIEVAGTSIAGFHHFINGFYGSFNYPNFETALEVVKLADKYQVDTIKSAAEACIVAFMKSNHDHINKSLQVASMTGCDLIREKAAGFFPTILTTDNVISYLLMADESKAIKIKYSCYQFMEKHDVTALVDYQLLSEAQLIDYITFIQSAPPPMVIRSNSGIKNSQSVSRLSHSSQVITFADGMKGEENNEDVQERLTRPSFPRWSTVSKACRGVTKSS